MDTYTVSCGIQKASGKLLYNTGSSTWCCVCVHVTFSVWPPSPSPAVFTSLFSISAALFLLCKWVHQYNFSRFHTYALIYDICFSLSDLLHSVHQALASSTSLQLTQINSFLWLSGIPLSICTTSLSIHVFGGHLGCFHVLAIVNSAPVNTEVHVSFRIVVFSEYMPSSGIAGSYGRLVDIFLVFK